MERAEAVVLPVVSAIVVGTLFGSLQRRAVRRGVPVGLFALAVVLALIGIVPLATVLLSGSVIDWIKQAPQMADALKAKLQWLDAGVAALRRIQNTISPGAGNAMFPVDFAAVARRR